MDTVMLIGRLLVSLAVVLGVVWLISRRMRKTGRGKANGLIEVLDRRQLSRGSSVAVVRVGDQALVIGVTENQVSVLGETDAAQAQAMTEAARPALRTAKVARASARTSGTKPSRAATSRRRNAVTSRAGVRAARTAAVEADTDPTAPTAAPAAGRTALAGSALSPQTWKQTIESLREMTAR